MPKLNAVDTSNWLVSQANALDSIRGDILFDDEDTYGNAVDVDQWPDAALLVVQALAQVQLAVISLKQAARAIAANPEVTN